LLQRSVGLQDSPSAMAKDRKMLRVLVALLLTLVVACVAAAAGALSYTRHESFEPPAVTFSYGLEFEGSQAASGALSLGVTTWAVVDNGNPQTVLVRGGVTGSVMLAEDDEAIGKVHTQGAALAPESNHTKLQFRMQIELPSEGIHGDEVGIYFTLLQTTRDAQTTCNTTLSHFVRAEASTNLVAAYSGPVECVADSHGRGVRSREGRWPAVVIVSASIFVVAVLVLAALLCGLLCLCSRKRAAAAPEDAIPKQVSKKPDAASAGASVRACVEV